MSIYLVKRGPRPAHHRAPFVPVIVTPRRDAARWEAGYSGEGAWIWEIVDAASGWLLVRWNGLDIDYGHVVRRVTLPDGDQRAFDHRHEHPETFALAEGAVWWSPRPMPGWVAEMGVVYPNDRFTQQTILDWFANDGASGFGRDIPAHWEEQGEY